MGYDEGWRQQQIAIEKLKAPASDAARGYPYTCPWCAGDVFLDGTLIGTCKCGAVLDGRRWPEGGWQAPEKTIGS